MRDKMKEIKDDPKGNKAKEDAMRDMNINDEYLNELSLDTLSQATRQAYSKREAARGTSEFVKRQRQTEKFKKAAVKKRRELDTTKDKIMRRVKEEYISELSPATLGGYIKKAKIDIRDTATDRVMAITGIKGAKSKLDKTAAAVKNLQKAREKNAFATSTLPLSAPPEPPVSALPYNQRIRKRAIGINKATDKLVDKATPTTEEYVAEDDMKGMSVKSGHKRPTKSGAGMTQKGVEAYRRRNPGSKLKTAVTGKVKKGSKDAKRRKSYCARSAGQMKKFPKAAKNPNSRLRQARKRWKC